MWKIFRSNNYANCGESRYVRSKAWNTLPGWLPIWNHWSYPRYQHQRYAGHESISRRQLHRNCMEYIELNKPHDDLMEDHHIPLFNNFVRNNYKK